MKHTFLAEHFIDNYQIPEQDRETCLETVDKFVLAYIPNDTPNSLLKAPEHIFDIFFLLFRLYKNPNKQIKKEITIENIINTYEEHLKTFHEIHKNSNKSSSPRNQLKDWAFFHKNMTNYFLEDC